MNDYDFFGAEIMHHRAQQYVAENFNQGDGYRVTDINGKPLFGLVPNDNKPIHKLILPQ